MFFFHCSFEENIPCFNQCQFYGNPLDPVETTLEKPGRPRFLAANILRDGQGPGTKRDPTFSGWWVELLNYRVEQICKNHDQIVWLGTKIFPEFKG